MRTAIRIAFWAFVAAILGACTPTSYTPAPSTQPTPQISTETVKIEPTLLLSQSLRPFIMGWQKEAHLRFPGGFVMIVGHGERFHGVWSIFPDDRSGNAVGFPVPVEWVLKDARLQYPDKPIILFVCNPHEDIMKGWPNVFYSLKNVWVIPDRDAGPIWNLRDFEEGDSTGSIFEFVEAT